MDIQIFKRHGTVQLKLFQDSILPPFVADIIKLAVQEYGFLLPWSGGPWRARDLIAAIERHYTKQPDAPDGSAFSFSPPPFTDQAQAMFNALRLAGEKKEQWRQGRYFQPPTALVLSCSDRKVGDRGPAINLYDGNMVRIVRSRKPRVQLFFLSAKYGLIEAEETIDTYDLTINHADWMPHQKTDQWVQSLLWRDAPTKKVYVCMGEAYYSRLIEMATSATNMYRLRWPSIERLPLTGGGIGEMQAALVEFCDAHQDDGLPIPGWHNV